MIVALAEIKPPVLLGGGKDACGKCSKCCGVTLFENKLSEWLGLRPVELVVGQVML